MAGPFFERGVFYCIKMSQRNRDSIQVTAGLIFKDGRLLITKRPEGTHLAGLWEFPGGKQETHETLEECLQREIREELGIEIMVNKLVLTVRHEYDTRVVNLNFFECTGMKGRPRAREGQEIRWVDPADLKQYTFPPPDRKILEYLISRSGNEGYPEEKRRSLPMKDNYDRKEDIIHTAFTLGIEYEKTIMGCCQCTIAAIQDALKIKNDTVFKAGTGLTAGGGVSCEGSCGGYVGGVMVMSSLFGRRRVMWEYDNDEKDCAHNMAKELFGMFNREYGSIICKRIHRRLFGRTFDLRNVRDREAFERLGAHVDKCTSVVGTAAGWATELILNEMENRGMTLNDL